jgi:thymidylate synthase
MKNGLDEQYIDLLKDILENGIKKDTRNGKVLSVFGRSIRYKFKDGKFPLLTTKKMAFKTMVTESLWFLRGDTNIKYLVDNNCHIWDGDAYKRFSHIRKSMLMLKPPASEDKLREYIEWYEQVTTQEEFINKIKTDDEFAKKWGDLGKIYGSQWRSWGTVDVDWGKNGITGYRKVDQIANLINDLKTNPDSRRLMVNAWNVGELDQMVLPPCHFSFQVYTRELSYDQRFEIFILKNERKFDWTPDKRITSEVLDELNIPTRAISLMYNARSQDVPLGTPFNIASYALLLEIIAKMVNMVPDELITNMGDCHIYSNQIDGIKEQLTREPYRLPKLVHMKTDDFYKSLSDDLSLLTHLDNTDFVVENYQSHPSIKMPLSN